MAFLQFQKPILMYHRVDDKFATSKLSVSPKSFSFHLDVLQQCGKRVVPVVEIAQNRSARSREVSLTFDDGFSSCYENAYPSLEARRMKATFFVVTDFIDKPGYMRSDQIRELHQSGHTIGSHSKTHLWLPELDQASLQIETADSKKELEDLLGSEVRIFSYPMGGVDLRVIEAVKAAGYEVACATRVKGNLSGQDPFTLSRLKVSRTSDHYLNLWWKISGYGG